ncbi:MAG: hypothetical protein WB723_02385 [Candidatus Acidiferrales bacterium]
MPEAADNKPLGFSRTLAVILLSVILGTAVGFIVHTAFEGWKLLELRWGWVLLSVSMCFFIRLALKRLAPGSSLALNKIARSTIPAWAHPAIWSFALGLASMQFGRISQLSWIAVGHAAAWATIDFIGMYGIMVVTYSGLPPAKWKREV